MIRAGIIGATGYAGQMLTWILYNHDSVEIVFLSSHNNTGMKYEEIYSNFEGLLEHRTLNMKEAEEQLSKIDVLFIALPHGKSFEITEKALKLGIKVIDLGADYRLKSIDTYEKWYGVNHQLPALVEKAEYGLVELNRKAIEKANLVANPGCYPTASILALAPLLTEGLIDKNSIIIDAKSGVSGAGRSAAIQNLFCECNESIKAYGLGNHRHTPEIEQELTKLYGEDVVITFTPHLVPMNRGIIATCYGNVNKSITQSELDNIYKEFYRESNFVKVVKAPPETRNVKGTNLCHVYAKLDDRTNRVIVVSVIDNLVKGAAGQAVQCMNLLFGLKETCGLNLIAMIP